MLYTFLRCGWYCLKNNSIIYLIQFNIFLQQFFNMRQFRRKGLDQKITNRMSVEKQCVQQDPVKTKVTLNCTPPNKIMDNTYYWRYHMLKAGPFVPTTGTIDKTVLWRGPIAQDPKLRKKFVVFKQIQYIISNWSQDQFPSVIYIIGSGMPGFFDETSVQTERIAALQLKDAVATMDQSSVRTYDLHYQIKNPVVWQIPPTLTQIVLKVKLDNQPDFLQLPLPNPLALNFEFRCQ